MQILKVPEHYKDMTAQISLTGITLLKTGKFKTRHAGLSQVVQKPVEGFILKNTDKLEIERLKNKKPRRKKIVNPEIEKCVKVLKPKSYTVNKKQVSHRIRNFVNQMPGEKKLFFWTITFPKGTSDDTAFICFNKWLTRCRRDLNLKSYLWVSERQQNKTIHYHIAIHQRMCVKKANRFMRACLFTCIDNKEIDYSREAAKNYNGVDIAKNRITKRTTNFAKKKSQKSLTNYLIKYVSKNNESFQHLAYHCSRDYSNLTIGFRLTDQEYLATNLFNYVDQDTPFDNEWITFYRWKKEPPDKVNTYMANANNKILSLLVSSSEHKN